MSEPIRVVIADDHPLFREGVARSLAESADFEVVGEGGSADEAIELAASLKPDIVLLDISMPGNGIAAARGVVVAAPNARIVMLTVSEADEEILAALAAGAKGYALKGIGSATLLDILRAVGRGESYVSPSLAARLLIELGQRDGKLSSVGDALARLTRREEEILQLVAKGLSNKEVGLKLDLREKTVKHHMTRILDKLQVRNRTEAAVLLREASAKRL